MSKSKLPSEIIVDILSRLPVKSLLRFRCVCKSWWALVSDPRFVKMHLNRATEFENTNLILTSGAKLYSLDSDDPIQFDLPFLSELRSIAVVGSCNGLVCLSDYANFGNISYIWNPATREYKKLPNPPSEDQRLRSGFSIVGLGHNAITDEFKLVRVTNLCHFEAYLVKVEVYTLGTDSWRSVGDVSLSIQNQFPMALVNGTLHWMGGFRAPSIVSDSIVSFDFGDEEFRQVSLPDFGDNDEDDGDDFSVISWKSLGVLGGCLCILRSFYGSAEIWVMEDYGLKLSWTKRFSFRWKTIAGHSEFVRPLSFSNHGKIFLENRHRDLVIYDPVRVMSRIFRIRGIPQRLGIDSYVGSLTSLVSLSANNELQAKEKRRKTENEKQRTDVGAIMISK